ncbi:phosphate acyltransferase, partial [Clostridioides difficile]|uniref:phosphate acyltransferase n=2 Tax=Clostridioides TaxID=1870884 RepID=UPI003F8D0781
MLKDFNNLLEEAKKLEPVIVSVAVAEDEEVLKAVKSATDLNLIKPILVGDKDKIENISKEIGLK